MNPYPRFFSLCLAMFLLACSVGINFALSFLDHADPHAPAWSHVKPVIGILVMLAALILNFVGYARIIQNRKTSAPEESGASDSVALHSPRIS